MPPNMMRQPFRLAGIGAGAVLGSIVVAALAVGCLVGLVLLLLWVTADSPSDYARKQVQALFVDQSLKRTGTVESCRAIGNGDAPGERIWACKVRGDGCVRTYRFGVDHEYGTEPYDSIAFEATLNPCHPRASG